VRIEVSVAGGGVGCGVESEGKDGGALVAVVHQRAEREAGRSGKLHVADGDSTGQGPVDLWRLTRIAGLHPIDVPARLERKDETDSS